jgi:transcriptional regulator with XRE-family HTH domain
MPRRVDMDSATRERIRAWLRHYSEARDWTNERLAEELGVSEPTVTNILNGKRSAGLDVVIKMHRRLHRSADDLLDTDPPSVRKPPPGR